MVVARFAAISDEVHDLGFNAISVRIDHAQRRVFDQSQQHRLIIIFLRTPPAVGPDFERADDLLRFGIDEDLSAEPETMWWKHDRPVAGDFGQEQAAQPPVKVAAMDRTPLALPVVIIGSRCGSSTQIVKKLLECFDGRTAAAAIDGCSLLVRDPQSILKVPPGRRKAGSHREQSDHRNGGCLIDVLSVQCRRAPNDQDEQQKQNAEQERRSEDEKPAPDRPLDGDRDAVDLF